MCYLHSVDVAQRQRPPAGELYLDHLAHFVPDLGAAAAVWEKLGFAVTPISVHNVSGKPAGTSNRCVMLEDGYLELLRPRWTRRTRSAARDRMKRFVACPRLFGTPGPAARTPGSARTASSRALVSLERKIETGESVRFSGLRAAGKDARGTRSVLRARRRGRSGAKASSTRFA